jgi:hypothetical protein
MTMRTHLEDDVLLDVLEGRAPAGQARHAAECPSCAGRIADARATLRDLSGAAAPEPSPLFWPGFRARVRAAVEGEPRAARWRGLFAPALIAAAAAVAGVLFMPAVTRAPDPAPAPVAVASAPVLEEAAVDLAGAPEDLVACPDVAECVASLTDDESRALAEALRADLAPSGDL